MANQNDPSDQPVDHPIGEGGRIDQAKALLKRLPQIFSIRIIPGLDDITLQHSIETLAPILLKLQQERDHRQSARPIDISSLLKYGPTEEMIQSLRRIFQNDDLSRERMRLVIDILEIFRSQGRATFTMEEMVQAVRIMKKEHVFGHTDEMRLRIVLGSLLGKTGLGLMDIQTKKGRVYVLPASDESGTDELP